ncbi:hypothetical protein BDF14DRAFT_1795241 [Spinellus fusiger]|nr:hypothetical protein BDF14DRAFT_1795241 [Spinellus fusiger]
MRDSMLKLFSSVRLVQEVSRSDPSSTAASSIPHPLETHHGSTPTPVPPAPSQQPHPSRAYHATFSVQTSTHPALPHAPLRTYARKNSKYRTRHHRLKSSSSYQSLERKNKSQKILCLWPLPVITRSIIVLSLLVSTFNFFQLLHLTCSAPSFVIYRLEIVNLLLSPFLFYFSLHSIVLFSWNVLILGLFEESLAHLLGSTRRFIRVLLGIVLTLSVVRQGLGYVFTKSTGWALPMLFFSNAVHECSQGLAPFLFALLVVQSLCIEDKYILIYGEEESDHKITIRKVTLQFFMCLVNYTVENIFWWSVTGLITGYIATLVIQSWLAHKKLEIAQDTKDVNEFITYEEYRRTPLWRMMWSAVKKGGLVVWVTLSVLLVFNAYYTHESPVDPTQLNMMSKDSFLFTMVFMTAPRRSNPPYLTQTLNSYLSNWPPNPAPGSLYSRIQTLVYTHFSNHTQFDVAKAHFDLEPKGHQYIQWIREEGDQVDQRRHVSKALDLVTSTVQTTYIALMEDDFPVCGPEAWREIESVVYKANQQVPNHCGVFVGTGGSGLFLKPHIARLVSRLLLQYESMPPDIIIQKCLLGELLECYECQQSLVTSKALLMYHIGYNTSTSDDRSYKKSEFQCGWRHPFNGDPQVITL